MEDAFEKTVQDAIRGNETSLWSREESRTYDDVSRWSCKRLHVSIKLYLKKKQPLAVRITLQLVDEGNKEAIMFLRLHYCRRLFDSFHDGAQVGAVRINFEGLGR